MTGPLSRAKHLAQEISRLHRLNIGPRLALCFISIILTMLGGSAVLLWQFYQARLQAERLTAVDQQLIAVLQAHTSLMSFYERLDVLSQSEDTTLLLKQVETLRNELLQESQRSRTALSKLSKEVELDPMLLPTLMAIQGELPAQLEAMAILAKSGDWNVMRLRLANQVRPLESRSAALVENVDREVGEQREQAVSSIRQAQRRIFLIVPITAAITLVFAALLGFVITRSITEPLGRLVEGSTALARGNFTYRVPATGNDEITRLGNVFNDMIVRLQGLYRDLQTSETYLAEAQKLSHTGSFGWDISSGEIYWSAETFRIFEFDPETTITVEAILARTHPEDRSALQQVMERASRDRIPLDVEHRLLMPGGSVKHLRVIGHSSTDNGNRREFVGAVMDITVSKRAERALAAKELSWRQIVDNIPGLVATMGPMGEVEFLNRQTLEYFGKTNEELKNWSLIGVVHPDDLPRVIEARAKAIEAGDIYEVEHRCRRADGLYRWFQVRGLPVRDTENKATAWYLLLTDIDDRKKAEEALQANERNLSLIINVIPTFILVLRTDGSVLYVNQAVLDNHGLTLEDVQQEDYRARFFHPEDVERLREQRREALTRPVPFENEQRVLAKDGKYRWFLIRYNPLLDEQGNIIRWYVAATDIEDRKRAEAEVEQAYLRLAEAQRLSKTGSFITDLVADDHNWSEEAFRIFEFDPATRVTVQMIRNIVHPEDLPTFDAVIARGMTGTDIDFAFRIVTSRGVMKHVRGMARLMAQIRSRPLFIGAIQDVTESKVAEEALDRARFELAHVARVTTLNTLTASIAHEVNQPLSGIVTNASTCLRMLNGDPPNIDGARETARRTIRDANRASDVITRLRALFGRKESTLEPLDLNEATREVIALSLSDLQRDRVILRTELADDLPPAIGDRVQLQQVTLNLLRNASDAMAGVHTRPRELLIRTRREGEDRVCLSVRDTGTGVDPQGLDRLFQAFYTTKSGGMGIGLSVSRSIIERHGGRLWAEPNEGPGATFSFSIPCDPERATAALSQ